MKWRFALRQPGYEVDITGRLEHSRGEGRSGAMGASDAGQFAAFANTVYVNQLGDTSDQLVRAGYGPSYARLVEIKKKYAPKNALRLNQNIMPR